MTSFQRKWQYKFLTRTSVTRIFQSHQQWTSNAFVSCGRDHFPIIYQWSVLPTPCYRVLVTVLVLSYISTASVALPAQSWADIKSFKSISFLRPVPSPRQHNSSQHQAGAGQMLLGLCWPGSKTLAWLPCTLPRAVDVVAVVGHFLMTLSTLSQFVLGHRTWCLARPRAFEPNFIDTCSVLGF